MWRNESFKKLSIIFYILYFEDLIWTHKNNIHESKKIDRDFGN